MNDNFLDYKLHNKVNLVPASISKRLINLVVDLICISVLIFSLITFYGIIYFGTLIFIVPWKIFLVFMIIYFGLCELLMSGRTFGKIITKTKVVTMHGYNPDLSALFVRGITRLIPIDGLFIFTSYKKPLHDLFSSTIVIDESLSDL